ncbi:hypothetical protein TSOC_001953 [Tetrabaena socialis]|uniref:Uncharacterized protein n=1 Tax=Tetrabaena socialis TaxID=47790 RepID=A0A2J8AFE8_9CHLO|nr:hypothetical protein TSOC_001953 [Tetrabaena socialis]|eukprot:PNH11241.1 hypothetical protein TSOC_001953 [Tetrabaena socialis]
MAERRVFAAIEVVEARMEETHKRRQERQEELLMELLRGREPLLQRRRGFPHVRPTSLPYARYPRAPSTKQRDGV